MPATTPSAPHTAAHEPCSACGRTDRSSSRASEPFPELCRLPARGQLCLLPPAHDRPAPHDRTGRGTSTPSNDFAVPTVIPSAPAQLLADAKRPLHTPAGLVGNTPVLWVASRSPRRARLLGQAGGLQPRRHQGPARACTWSTGRAPGATCAPAPRSSSPPAAPSASAWPWPASSTATRSPWSPTPAWSRR